MGSCQQSWLDPQDFTTKVCGAETDRKEGDRFVCMACFKRLLDFKIKMAEQMVCPRCGSPLQMVPAREMHPAHKEHDLARKCTKDGCAYICYMGDEVNP
ncbi:MAG: hypothetical protein WC683_01060 [bacterium]